MIRRFTASILALVMLLCALPLSVGALEIAEADKPSQPYLDCPVYNPEEDRIYYKDEYVWVKGQYPEELSEEDVEEGCEWTALGIKRCGDGLLQHTHVGNCQQYVEDLQGNVSWEYICGFAPEYNHKHNNISGCMGWKAYYLYQVTSNESESGGSESEDNEPPAPVVNDGYNEASGSMYFEVHCVNAKGEPLPYVSFGIATAKTDDQGRVQYTADGTPLMDEGIVSKTTNSEGKLRFNSLEKFLQNKYQPWILYQDASEFITDEETGKVGRYYNQYYSCDTFYSISGGLKFSVAKESKLEKETPVVAPGYANGVLTYVNERIRGQLDINVKFMDENGNSISGSSCEVTIKSEKAQDGYPKTMIFPLSQSTRNDSWGDSLYDLQPGKYTVESNEPAEIDGYGYVETTYELLVKEKNTEVWKESNTADLGADFTLGIFRITHHYERGISTDRISIRTVDEDNVGRSGASYELYDPMHGETYLFTDSDAEFTLVAQDVSGIPEDGETVTLLLTQKNPPKYHTVAEESYEIDVTKEDGRITMALRDENGDNCAVDGLQTAVFVSRKGDQSNTVIVKAVESEKAENGALPGGTYTVYENGEKVGQYELREETSLRMDDFDFASRAEPGKTHVFELEQRFAPTGYKKSDDVYTVTVTKENGKPKVQLAKIEQDQTLMTRIARAIGIGGVEIGEYGEQIAVFENEKAPSNIIAMESYDAEGSSVLQAKYKLSLPSSGRVIDDNITGSLDMSAYYGYLREGEQLEFRLEQSWVQDGYEPSQNRFRITVVEEGDNAYPEITEENGDGSNVESGPEAQIVKFQNKKKLGTTKISLFLADNVVEWPEDGAEDTQYLDDLKNRAYEYVLEWSYDGSGGEEARMVKPNERVEFEKELPLGAEYKIRPGKNFEDAIKTGLTGKSEGVVTEMQLYKVTNVTATHTYKIVAGNYAPELQLIKVDAADPQKVLPGATFALRGPDGKAFMQVTSDANGIIDISEALAEPAVHVMLETEAPAGYEKLSDYVEIRIAYDYTPATVDGEKVFVQNLNATATHPDAVEEIDGKYYIKNKLRPGDAKIHLTMDVQNPSWGKGTKTDTSYLKNEYSFLLSWQDANGKKQTEVLSLSTKNGKNQGTFKTSIPVGTEYKIAPIGDNIIYNAIFTGNGIAQSGTGTVNSSEDVNVVAALQHNFVAGKYKPEVYMLKVNAKNFNRTLAGAKFSLKDETGVILKTYLTQKDGAIELVDVLDDYPTSYTLTEIAAPEEYVKLKKAISIDLEYEYVPRRGTDGKITATQNLVARVHHDNVEQGSDGWYYIKNSHTSDIPQTGDAFNPVFWTGLLTISAAGIAVLLTTTRRRRKVR